MIAPALLAAVLAALAVLVWFLPAASALERTRRWRPGPAYGPRGRPWLAAVRAAVVVRRPGARAARARARVEAVAVADALSACLSAGCSPAEAAAAVAQAHPGPAGERLAHAVTLIRLGADPAQAWRTLAETAGLAAIGRALARSAESGTAAASLVAAEAARRRLDRRLDADAAIARLGVLAAAPLGLCFLPAFVCLGVLPVVLGLGATLLGGSS